MLHVKQIYKYKLNQIFFWLFLVSLPFNKRIIYNPEHAYINGYFSYYLAYFVYVSDILLFLCLVSYVTEGGLKFTRDQWYKNPVFWLILAIITSLFHVQHGFWVSYSCIKALELVSLGLFLSSDLQNLHPRIIAWILVLSAYFQAILGFLQFHVQRMVGFGLLGEYVSPLGTGGLSTLDNFGRKIVRAYGTFPHPNILAAFLVLGLILGYFLIVSRETTKKAQIFLIIGEFLLIVGIFLTFSRVAWVASALSTIFFLWRIRKDKKRLILAIIPIIVSCATIFFAWNNLILDRVTNIQSSNSYTQRVALDNAGFRIWKTNPVVGVGLGNYILSMKKLFHVQPWEYQPSHNIFIYILASLGIVGLGAFLWLLFMVFRSTWNSPNTDLRFTLLILGMAFILMSNFDHFLVTIQQGQLMFALLLGMMGGLPKLKQPNA